MSLTTTPQDKVQRMYAAVSAALETISTMFKPGIKLSFIARSAGNPEGDVLIGDDDDAAEIIALVRRRLDAVPVAPPDVLTVPKAIMDITVDQRQSDEYKRGHRDARHAAADLVLELADRLVALTAAPVAVAVESGQDVKPMAHGHRGDYYLLANAKRIGMMPIRQIANMSNWHLAHHLFATGSNSAHQICVDAGIDPYGHTVERTSEKP